MSLPIKEVQTTKYITANGLSFESKEAAENYTKNCLLEGITDLKVTHNYLPGMKLDYILCGQHYNGKVLEILKEKTVVDWTDLRNSCENPPLYQQHEYNYLECRIVNSNDPDEVGKVMTVPGYNIKDNLRIHADN